MFSSFTTTLNCSFISLTTRLGFIIYRKQTLTDSSFKVNEGVGMWLWLPVKAVLVLSDLFLVYHLPYLNWFHSSVYLIPLGCCWAQTSCSAASPASLRLSVHTATPGLFSVFHQNVFISMNLSCESWPCMPSAKLLVSWSNRGLNR